RRQTRPAPRVGGSVRRRSACCAERLALSYLPSRCPGRDRPDSGARSAAEATGEGLGGGLLGPGVEIGHGSSLLARDHPDGEAHSWTDFSPPATGVNRPPTGSGSQGVKKHGSAPQKPGEKANDMANRTTLLLIGAGLSLTLGWLTSPLQAQE